MQKNEEPKNEEKDIDQKNNTWKLDNKSVVISDVYTVTDTAVFNSCNLLTQAIALFFPMSDSEK